MKKIIIYLFLMSSFIFARDLEEIKESGYLIIGIRNIPAESIYQPKNIEKPGFSFELAQKFADYLGVKIKVHTINKFKDYWTKDGKIMSTKLETPDIYNEIDIATDIITLTEKRKKIVNMVPFIETFEIFFTKKSIKVDNYENFKGKKFITMEALNFYTTIKTELDKRNIKYVINKVSVKNNEFSYIGVPKKISPDEVEILLIPSEHMAETFSLYYQIEEGYADISMLDSFVLFPKIFGNSNTRKNLKLLFAANDRIEYLAFCTSYKTHKLNKELSEFIKKYKETTKFNIFFQKYLGLTYSEYKDIYKK